MPGLVRPAGGISGSGLKCPLGQRLVCSTRPAFRRPTGEIVPPQETCVCMKDGKPYSTPLTAGAGYGVYHPPQLRGFDGTRVGAARVLRRGR